MAQRAVHSSNVHECLLVSDSERLSRRVEGAVKANTSVRNVKGVGRLCARALCQELHVFIRGGGVSENDPRNLPDDCQIGGIGEGGGR